MKKCLLLIVASLLLVARALAQTATVTPSPATYSATGGQITFTVALTFPTAASAASFSIKPATNTWSHVSTAHISPVPPVTTPPTTPYSLAVQPEVGATTATGDVQSVFGWAYADLAVLGSGSASFTFTLSYPAGLTGPQTFTPAADYRVGGVLTSVTIPALVIQPTPVPPTITNPSSVTVVAGANASFSVTATGLPTPSLKWQRSTDNGLNWSDLANDSTHGGVLTANLTITAATVGMNGYRFRALATNGAIPDATSSGATLTVTQAPIFVNQPLGQSVIAGDSATFVVSATGLPVPTYRWYFTPTGSSTPQALSDAVGKLAGTATPTLVVSNVQTSDVGDYVCIATNSVGTTTSVAAQLTIAARVIRIVSQTVAPGATFSVPIQLVATGTENALGFSLTFDPAFLTFQSAAVGANAADATLNTNSSQSASGRVGFAMAKPAGVSWSAGTQEVIKVTFLLNAASANGAITPLGFGNTPIAQEVASVTATTLPAGFQAGNVSVLAGYEADMNGNGSVTITDWVKVGRIVAGLDPAPTGVDFMKADCAPRSTLGNGSLSVTDWVQAGRYAAGLDPITPVGGPTSP